MKVSATSLPLNNPFLYLNKDSDDNYKLFIGITYAKGQQVFDKESDTVFPNDEDILTLQFDIRGDTSTSIDYSEYEIAFFSKTITTSNQNLDSEDLKVEVQVNIESAQNLVKRFSLFIEDANENDSIQIQGNIAYFAPYATAFASPYDYPVYVLKHRFFLVGPENYNYFSQFDKISISKNSRNRRTFTIPLVQSANPTLTEQIILLSLPNQLDVLTTDLQETIETSVFIKGAPNASEAGDSNGLDEISRLIIKTKPADTY